VLLIELTLVELELGTLQDVTIAATGLARAGSDAGHQTTAVELLLEMRVQLLVLLVLGLLVLQLGLGVTRLLLLGLSLGAGLLLTQGHAVVLQVPLTERSGIDQNNGVLNQSLGADQLVVGGVVDDVSDADLAGAVLGTPGEVALIQAQRTVLGVTTTSADGLDAGGTEVGLGGRAAHLELPLLLVDVDLTTGGAVLVTGVTSNTHLELSTYPF